MSEVIPGTETIFGATCRPRFSRKSSSPRPAVSHHNTMPPRLAAMAGGSSSLLSSSTYKSNDRSATSHGDTEMNGSMRPEPELEEVDVDTLYLQPSAFKRKEKGKWQESGKSISFGLNPVNGEVASWVAHRVRISFTWSGDLLMVRLYLKRARLPLPDPQPPLLSISSFLSLPSTISRKPSLCCTRNHIPSSHHFNISSLVPSDYPSRARD